MPPVKLWTSKLVVGFLALRYPKTLLVVFGNLELVGRSHLALYSKREGPTGEQPDFVRRTYGRAPDVYSVSLLRPAHGAHTAFNVRNPPNFCDILRLWELLRSIILLQLVHRLCFEGIKHGLREATGRVFSGLLSLPVCCERLCNALWFMMPRETSTYVQQHYVCLCSG